MILFGSRLKLVHLDVDGRRGEGEGGGLVEERESERSGGW
jgi:hypothetical protein